MSRGALRLVGLTVMLGLSIASPAHAADEIELSRDGQTWGATIAEPLFSAATRWVPGDSRTVMFYLRNAGGTPGDLTIELIGSRAGRLIDSGDLHVTVRGGGGSWDEVAEAGTYRLLSTPTIDDGRVVPVTMTVAFDQSSRNVTRLESTPLRFRVALAQSMKERPGAGLNDGAGENDRDGLLPDTGAPGVRWSAGLAAVCLGGAMALVARRRPYVEEDSHV